MTIQSQHFTTQALVYCLPVSQFNQGLFQVGQAGVFVPHIHCSDGGCILQTNPPQQSKSQEQVPHGLDHLQVHCPHNRGILHTHHTQHSQSVVQD